VYFMDFLDFWNGNESLRDMYCMFVCFMAALEVREHD
jgi:hypothetical protein